MPVDRQEYYAFQILKGALLPDPMGDAGEPYDKKKEPPKHPNNPNADTPQPSGQIVEPDRSSAVGTPVADPQSPPVITPGKGDTSLGKGMVKTPWGDMEGEVFQKGQTEFGHAVLKNGTTVLVKGLQKDGKPMAGPMGHSDEKEDKKLIGKMLKEKLGKGFDESLGVITPEAAPLLTKSIQTYFSTDDGGISQMLALQNSPVQHVQNPQGWQTSGQPPQQSSPAASPADGTNLLASDGFADFYSQRAQLLAREDATDQQAIQRFHQSLEVLNQVK